MAYQKPVEPRLSKESQKFAMDMLFGETNIDLQTGNLKTEMARIVGGNSFRYMESLLSLQSRFKSFDTKQVLNHEIIGTVALSPELSDMGGRGELTFVLTQSEQPKKESIVQTKSGMLRQPTTPEPQGVQQ